jgi:hypothetical protein
MVQIRHAIQATGANLVELPAGQVSTMTQAGPSASGAVGQNEDGEFTAALLR